MRVFLWEKRNVFLLVSVIVLCKVAIIFFLIPEMGSEFPKLYQIEHFPDGYDKIGLNLLQGYGYRFYPDSAQTMVRMPLYPYVLTTIFYFFGKNLAAVQALNIFFSLVTAYFVFHITKNWIVRADHKLPMSRLLFPSIILLFHPGVVLAESRGGVENLLMLLITAFVFFLYKALTVDLARNYLVAGIVFGFMLLTKSTPALFPFFLMAYVFFAKNQHSMNAGRTFINLGVFLVACSIVYSPWVIRNYSLTDKIVPTGTIQGFAAHQGLHLNKNHFSDKQVHELFMEDAAYQNIMIDELGLKAYKRGFFKHFYSPKDELAFDDYLFEDVIQQYKDSPPLLGKAAALNFLGFWFQGRTTASTLLNTTITLPLLIFFIFGLWKGYSRKINIAPIVLFIVAFLLPHLPTLGLARYHIPIIPLLAIVAMVPFQTGGRADKLLGR